MITLFYFFSILVLYSWFLRVYIGHYIIELNQPSLIQDYRSISYLSITQAELIAWKS